MSSLSIAGCGNNATNVARKPSPAATVPPTHFAPRTKRLNLRPGFDRRLGNARAALADYTAAIGAGPPYPEPYYNRADLEFELGDIEAAVRDLTRVIELDPAMADAWINRASAFCQLGRSAEAMHDVTAGLALQPDSAHLHCLRGSLLLGSGSLKAAEEALRNAVRLDPGAGRRLGEPRRRRPCQGRHPDRPGLPRPSPGNRARPRLPAQPGASRRSLLRPGSWSGFERARATGHGPRHAESLGKRSATKSFHDRGQKRSVFGQNWPRS